MKPPIAAAQYAPTPVDLQLVLALTRAGTLAVAGARLGVNPSTVFRALQRLERALGASLFDRSRAGSVPTELAQLLARHGERIEAELEAALGSARAIDGPVDGLVRITSTDVLLKHLVVPGLAAIARLHPGLQFELIPGYDLANLSRREADIALRATSKPPPHMVGRRLGTIHEAVFGRRAGRRVSSAVTLDSDTRWIGLDDAVPNHPATRWRQRRHPKAQLVLKVGSIESVGDAIEAGIGVGVLPLFVAHGRRQLVPLSPVLEECDTELWLLTHPESRHLRRIATAFGMLAESIRLD